jgi:energy-coupling factor transporter ATP-binding protein EcfA2
MNIEPLRRIELTNFTAFSDLAMDFSPGVNVVIGKNGTGKTHILKALYAACDITRVNGDVAEKLRKVFLPFEDRFGRLAHRTRTSVKASLAISRAHRKLVIRFSNHTQAVNAVSVKGQKAWCATKVECAFIPVKEMLAHAPGFRSLYAARNIHFEEIYSDIIDRAFLPILKGPIDADRRQLLKAIEQTIEGKVIAKGEYFFLKNSQGELEFSLLAEGARKLALLWLLIQNGTLLNGTVLFWDEPESNLNPRVIGQVVEILLELQRQGVQVFIATHDYVVLKEFDLRRKKDDHILFHSLYNDPQSKNVKINSAESFLDVHPNMIAETFAELYDRDIRRALVPEAGK